VENIEKYTLSRKKVRRRDLGFYGGVDIKSLMAMCWLKMHGFLNGDSYDRLRFIK